MSNGELPAAAIAALHSGNKIEAIKIVRQAGTLGLKEAKDQVDRYVLAHPELHTSLARRQSSGVWLALVLLLILLGSVYWWMRST